VVVLASQGSTAGRVDTRHPQKVKSLAFRSAIRGSNSSVNRAESETNDLPNERFARPTQPPEGDERWGPKSAAPRTYDKRYIAEYR
jgi:hypothetical protein